MTIDKPARPRASARVTFFVEGALQLRVLSSLPSANPAYFRTPLLLEHQCHPFRQVHSWQGARALDEGGYVLLWCDVVIFPFAHQTLWAVLLGVALLATSLALVAFSA